jgi:hypothetical protein
MGRMVKDESNAQQTEPEPQAEATAASGERRSSPNPHRKTTHPAGLLMAEYSPGQLSKWGDFSESANVRGHGTPEDTGRLQTRYAADMDRSEIGPYLGGHRATLWVPT